MEIQVFNNWNAALREKYASFWSQPFDSAFYAPKTYREFWETDVLNNPFFEPSASFWAVDGDSENPTPIACVVAASAPTADALDGADATLFGPLFAAGVDDAKRATVARALIEASEKALRAKGFRRVYAGGAPSRTVEEGCASTGSPFLNGVYGVGSPVGFFDDDPARRFFLDAGYRDERSFVEWKLDAKRFYVGTIKLPPGWKLEPTEDRRASSWRLATIERDFANARGFVVYGLAGEAEASVWGYETPGEADRQTAVARLQVRPEHRGRPLEKTLKMALLAKLVAQTPKNSKICAVLSADDVGSGNFWKSLRFEQGRRATALVKTL